MSMHQVEDFYLHMESSDFDLDTVKEMCNEEGLDFELRGDYFTVETFYSEGEAMHFESMLNNYAGVKS